MENYYQDLLQKERDNFQMVLSEQSVKCQPSQEYQEKMKELERRSLYLDRSLELIEEMKEKFSHLEG